MFWGRGRLQTAYDLEDIATLRTGDTVNLTADNTRLKEVVAVAQVHQTNKQCNPLAHHCAKAYSSSTIMKYGALEGRPAQRHVVRGTALTKVFSCYNDPAELLLGMKT